MQTDYVLSTAEGREQYSHTALGPVGAGGRRAVDTEVRNWMGERRERESYSMKVHTIADTGLSILQRKSIEVTHRAHVFLSPGLISVCENAMLMLQVRGRWPDYYEMIEINKQLLQPRFEEEHL